MTLNEIVVVIVIVLGPFLVIGVIGTIAAPMLSSQLSRLEEKGKGPK